MEMFLLHWQTQIGCFVSILSMKPMISLFRKISDSYALIRNNLSIDQEGA